MNELLALGFSFIDMVMAMNYDGRKLVVTTDAAKNDGTFKQVFVKWLKNWKTLNIGFCLSC